jgi:ABC-type antimicrobial peptide transport system permease subunit
MNGQRYSRGLLPRWAIGTIEREQDRSAQASLEVNERMYDVFGSFLAMSVTNTLILAFFVVCAIGVVGSIYAARAFKRSEAARAQIAQNAPKKD